MNQPLIQVNEEHSLSIEKQINSQLQEKEEDNEERDLINFYVLDIMQERGFNSKITQVALNTLEPEIYHTHAFSDILEIIMSRVTTPKKEETIYHSQQNLIVRQDSIRDKLLEAITSKSVNVASYLDSSRMKNSQLCDIQCQICFGNIQTKQLFVLKCGHQFCRQCLVEFCQFKIMDGQADIITCPDCEKPIEEETLKLLLDENTFNKMLKFRKIKSLITDKFIIWCPNPSCDSYVRYKGKKTIVQCQCGQEICTNCHKYAHKTKSCTVQMDKAYKKALKEFKIQKCKKCQSPLQKDDGCNHMTCKQCHYQFCWLCKEKYTPNHYGPFNLCGCPGMQYSQRDPYLFPNFYRFLTIFFLIIFSPLILLLGTIILIITLPALLYLNKVPQVKFKQYKPCKKVCIAISLILLCFICIPISLAAVFVGIAILIVGSPYFGYLLIKQYCY